MAAADTFFFKGEITVSPAPEYLASFGQTIRLSIAEEIPVTRRISTMVNLVNDSVYNLDTSEVSSAKVLVLKADSKVSVTVTSADGTAQVLPVDTFLVLTCASTPITALSFQRVPGVINLVRVILAS